MSDLLHVDGDSNRRFARSLTACAFIGMVFVACAEAPRADNSIVSENSATYCLTDANGTVRQLNLQILTNHRDQVITLSAVDLMGNQGVDVESAWALPVEDWAALTMGGKFPSTDPSRDGLSPSPVPGARILPDERVGLLLVVDVGEAGGSWDSVRVEFQVDEQPYFATVQFGARFPAAGISCD